MHGPPRTTHKGVVTRLLAAGVDVVAVVLLTVAVLYLIVEVGDDRADLRRQTARPARAVEAARPAGLDPVTAARPGLCALARGTALERGQPGAQLSPGHRVSLQDIVFRSIVVYDSHPYVDARAAEASHPGQMV
jgi:hypothetical protein